MKNLVFWYTVFVQSKFIKLVVSLSLPFVAGSIGSYFTIPSIDSWYQTLNKPIFSPPDWVFGLAWTILYILMGISFYLIWASKKKNKKSAIKFFLIQLVLNASWSIIFFGLHNPLLAFINIIVLWIAIYMTIRAFTTPSKTAAYLLYPYLAWVSFATILNLSIVLLN